MYASLTDNWLSRFRTLPPNEIHNDIIVLKKQSSNWESNHEVPQKELGQIPTKQQGHIQYQMEMQIRVL